jgi:RNA-directed DNA polymerase
VANALNRMSGFMKRYSNLYDQVCTRDNILKAYHQARAGKARAYGIRIFDRDIDGNLESVYQDLVTGSYRISAYDIFTIYEPKERIIYRLPFCDRIVQHAIMNVLEPIWVSVFIRHTYACVKGRGIHAALRDIKRDLKDVDGTHYCLKLDIRKFYPSINHALMKTIIRKKIKDERMLALLDGIIDSADGLPIGNYLSQYLANLYLSYMDHYMKEVIKVKYYYRYADDIVILASNKPVLHEIRAKMDGYLSNSLKLQMKGNYQVFPVDERGIDFVGYVFRHTHILMRKSIKQNMCRRAAVLGRRNIEPSDYKRLISPYIGWAKHCNSKNLINKVIDSEKIL